MWKSLSTLSAGRLTTMAVLWAAAMLGVLQLQHLDLGQSSHAVCGPWGCGPPLQVLLACHGFWFVVLAPPTWVACNRLPLPYLRTAGWALLAVGLAGLIGIGAWQVFDWLPGASATQRQYLFERYLFSIAVFVDVPFAEVFLCGVACQFARFTGRNRVDAETRPSQQDEVPVPLQETALEDANIE